MASDLGASRHVPLLLSTGLLAYGFGLRGRFWDAMGRQRFDNLGYVIIATFLLGWVVSVLVYRWKNYEAA